MGIGVVVINLVVQFTNIWVLLVCRLVSGVFVGLYLGLIPIYIHEICPHCVSGSLGAFTQLAHILGVTFCYFVGMIFYFTEGKEQGYSQDEFVVRFQLSITSVLILMQLVCMIIEYVPESPSSLIIARRMDKAREVLVLFHGEDHIEELMK